jgi:sugar/nucleoside kinase (ribokinase family)
MFSPVPAVELLTVGEAFEDLVFSGLARLPGPGEEVKTSAFHRTIGGGAVITAVTAARLGVGTRILSALGPDAVARLRRERVGVGNLLHAGEPHAISAALSTRADRSFVTFNGVNDALEARLAGPVRQARAGHVHFAFYPHQCRTWTRLVEGCRARAVTTSWDFGWHEGLLQDRGFGALLGAVDHVFVNEREALLYARSGTMRAALAFWRGRARSVVIKLGRRGSRWLAPDRDLTLAPPRVRAVDTTGAGDAFNGGFLYGLLRGLPARRCLEAGNFTGARSTRAAGGLDGLPDARQLPARLRRARQGPVRR